MSQQDPSDAQRLSQAIANARNERRTRSDDLDRFRSILMRERKAGAPVRALRAGLAKIGIDVSEETLRTWLIANGDPKPRGATPSPKTKPVPTAPMPRKQATALTAAVQTPPPIVRGPGPRVARDDI